MAPFDGTLETETRPVVVTDRITKHFLDAADLIEQRGLAKSTLMARDGSLCALGALSVAAGWWDATTGCWTHIGYQDEIENAWAQRLGVRWIGDICYWNNAPHRTKEEVVARLRAAAYA